MQIQWKEVMSRVALWCLPVVFLLGAVGLWKGVDLLFPHAMDQLQEVPQAQESLEITAKEGIPREDYDAVVAQWKAVEASLAVTNRLEKLEISAGDIMRHAAYSANQDGRKVIRDELLAQVATIQEKQTEATKKIFEGQQDVTTNVIYRLQQGVAEAKDVGDTMKFLSGNINSVKNDLVKQAKDPEVSLDELENLIRAAYDNAGLALEEDYLWTAMIQIVPSNPDGTLSDGLGRYTVENGQAFWKERPPEAFARLPDGYELFSERDYEESYFTHVRVVAKCNLSINLSDRNVRLVAQEDPTKPRLVTVTLPAPTLTRVSFVWRDSKVHPFAEMELGMGLMSRQKPFNVINFALRTDYDREQWENYLLEPFLMDVAENQAVDLTNFYRKVGNRISSEAEKYGYSVTVAPAHRNMRSLIKEYINKRRYYTSGTW